MGEPYHPTLHKPSDPASGTPPSNLVDAVMGWTMQEVHKTMDAGEELIDKSRQTADYGKYVLFAIVGAAVLYAMS